MPVQWVISRHSARGRSRPPVPFIQRTLGQARVIAPLTGVIELPGAVVVPEGGMIAGVTSVRIPRARPKPEPCSCRTAAVPAAHGGGSR